MIFSLRIFMFWFHNATETVRMEYLRRGRPLKATKWSVEDVSRYMQYFLHNKEKGEDCGVFAKYFTPGPRGEKSPFPEEMLEWERLQNKVWMGRVVHY